MSNSSPNESPPPPAEGQSITTETSPSSQPEQQRAPVRAMSEPSRPPPEPEPEPVKKRTFTSPDGEPITVVQAAPAPSPPPLAQVVPEIVGETKPQIITIVEPVASSPAISPLTVVPEVKDTFPIMVLTPPEKTKQERKEQVEAVKEERKEQVEVAKEEKKAEIQAVKDEKMAEALTVKEERQVEVQAAKEEKMIDAGAEAAKKSIEKEAVIEKKITEKERPTEEPRMVLRQAATMPVTTQIVETPAPVLDPVKAMSVQPKSVETMSTTFVPVEAVSSSNTHVKQVPVISESTPATAKPPMVLVPAMETVKSATTQVVVVPANSTQKVVESSPIIPPIVAPASTPVMLAKDPLPAPAFDSMKIEELKKTEIVEKPVMVIEKPRGAKVNPVIEAVEEKTVIKTMPAPTTFESMRSTIPMPVMTFAHQPATTATYTESHSAGYLEPLSKRIAIFSRYTAQSSTTLRFSDKFHHQLVDPSNHAVFHFLQKHHLVDDTGTLVACIHKSLWLGR